MIFFPQAIMVRHTGTKFTFHIAWLFWGQPGKLGQKVSLKKGAISKSRKNTLLDKFRSNVRAALDWEKRNWDNQFECKSQATAVHVLEAASKGCLL